MLREPHERLSPFGRRDAVRLVIAAVLIVVALAAGVASDLSPTSPGYSVGTVAKSAIQAPRDATFPNPIETKAARDAASAAVLPVYDYTQGRAASIAATQVTQLEQQLKPIDAAYISSATPEAQRAALQTAVAELPSLSSDGRTILLTLDSNRWLVVEQAAESSLSAGEQFEIRDADLAAKGSSIAAQYIPAVLNLNPVEQELAVALATPMFVANSAYSATLTEQARAAAVAAIPTRMDTLKAGEVIVDQNHQITDADMVKISYFGLDKSTVEWGKAAAWMLLGTIVAALMLGCCGGSGPNTGLAAGRCS